MTCSLHHGVNANICIEKSISIFQFHLDFVWTDFYCKHHKSYIYATIWLYLSNRMRHDIFDVRDESAVSSCTTPYVSGDSLVRCMNEETSRERSDFVVANVT